MAYCELFELQKRYLRHWQRSKTAVSGIDFHSPVIEKRLAPDVKQADVISMLQQHQTMLRAQAASLQAEFSAKATNS